MISIISTYKNRRPHIEQTLPTWSAQEASVNYEIVIVDYDSDDDISVFMRQISCSHPIRRVRCRQLPVFHLSHARNIGARAARHRWLFYIDIDTMLWPDSLKKIVELCKEDHYFAAVDSQIRKDIINGGLILVQKKHHDSICGFNENLKGWGYEDIDYKLRLEGLGLTYEEIEPSIYTCIDHPDENRTCCYNVEKEISWTRNRQIALQTWDIPRHGLWNNLSVEEY